MFAQLHSVLVGMGAAVRCVTNKYNRAIPMPVPQVVGDKYLYLGSYGSPGGCCTCLACSCLRAAPTLSFTVQLHCAATPLHSLLHCPSLHLLPHAPEAAFAAHVVPAFPLIAAPLMPTLAAAEEAARAYDRACVKYRGAKVGRDCPIWWTVLTRSSTARHA